MTPESSSPSERASASNTRAEVPQEEADPAAAAAPSLSLDLIFGLLKNQRRRRAVTYLSEADGMVSLSELSEHIAALEHDTTPAALTSTERKRVYVALYQIHLPKLDDAGVIMFNKPRGHITLGPTVSQLMPYLKCEPTPRAPTQWARYYLGLTIGSSGVFLVLLLAGRRLWLSGVISGLFIGILALSFWQYHYAE